MSHPQTKHSGMGLRVITCSIVQSPIPCKGRHIDTQAAASNAPASHVWPQLGARQKNAQARGYSRNAWADMKRNQLNVATADRGGDTPADVGTAARAAAAAQPFDASPKLGRLFSAHRKLCRRHLMDTGYARSFGNGGRHA